MPCYFLVTLAVAAADVSCGREDMHARFDACSRSAIASEACLPRCGTQATCCACSRHAGMWKIGLPNGGSSLIDADGDGCSWRRQLRPILGGHWTLVEGVPAEAGAQLVPFRCSGRRDFLALFFGRDDGAWRLTLGHAGSTSCKDQVFLSRYKAAKRRRMEAFARRWTLGHAGDVEILGFEIGGNLFSSCFF